MGANTKTNTKSKPKRKLPEALAKNLWQPGQSGNPSGRPKKKPITQLFEELMNDEELVAQFKMAVANSIKKGGMAGVMYMKEAADRLEGKVSQPIEADVTLHSLSERMRKAKERLRG